MGIRILRIGSILFASLSLFFGILGVLYIIPPILGIENNGKADVLFAICCLPALAFGILGAATVHFSSKRDLKRPSSTLFAVGTMMIISALPLGTLWLISLFMGSSSISLDSFYDCCLPEILFALLGIFLIYAYSLTNKDGRDFFKFLRDSMDPKSTEVLWLKKCPVCKKGKVNLLEVVSSFGLIEDEYRECNNCGTRFEKTGSLYNICEIKDKTNSVWNKYGNRYLSEDEWNKIAEPSMIKEENKEIIQLNKKIVASRIDYDAFIEKLEFLNKRGHNLWIGEREGTVIVKKTHSLMTIEARYDLENDELYVQGHANWLLIILGTLFTDFLFLFVLAFYYPSKKEERTREVRELVTDAIESSKIDQKKRRTKSR